MKGSKPTAETAGLSVDKLELLKLLLEEESLEPASAEALPRRTRQDELPLSFAQQRLWFLDHWQPGASVYNVSAVIRLAGRLDASALEASLDEVVRRHEVLRASFETVEGRPRQTLAPSLGLRLDVHDLSQTDASTPEEEARRLAREEAQRPFDLSKAPLLRARLLRLSDEEHVCLLTMHHIVSDGWSMGVLVREVAALYGAFREGRASPLPELPIQYADYAAWQRERLSGEALEGQLAYWRKQLAGAPASLELPTDYPRPAVRAQRGAEFTFEVGADVGRRLREAGEREGATLFMTLLAAWQALLSRYTGQTDISVGSPTANRNRAETEPLIGFFVNTLVLRADLSGDPTFRELLARVRESALGAYAHEELPFEKLVEELQPARNLSYTPLFQVVFALDQMRRQTLELPGLRLGTLEVDNDTAKFDLTLLLSEEEGGELSGVLEYDSDLFERATVGRMVGHFQNLLCSVANDSSRRLSELPLLGEEERRHQLYEWNETARPYPRLSVAELFSEQAARTPGAEAVVCGDSRLSYAELDERANRLSNYLRRLGVRAGARVGLCAERSLEMITGMLGILKAGGAYVPLDPSYPAERLAFMLEDTAAPVLLTQKHLLANLPAFGGQVLLLDEDGPAVAAQSASGPESFPGPDEAAYVIYTSGSTGGPKGVEVPHRGIVRLLFGADYARLDAEQTVLQMAPISFDASTLEIWGALLKGGRCVLYPERVPTAERIGALIRSQRVTTAWLTASLFNALVDESPDVLRGLQQLLVGGEALSVAHVRRAQEALPGTLFINGYGPTESTTFTCCYAIPAALGADARTIPIGRPIGNTTVYVLDARMNPVPVGVAGDLYVGGDGLALGYLRRPALTAERFVPDPFGREPGARLYRTGDSVKYLPDGNLEFLGRLDDQIKLRGFRIELGEVEVALKGHPSVRQLTVLLREDAPGDKRLVAYVVADAGAPLNVAELRQFAEQRLPEYMVPSAFVALDRLPLTANGKVDRRALPPPESALAETQSEYVPPRDLLELQLTQIWEDVLGRERVGVHDNFFELGGHSLLAVRLMTRVARQFSRELPLSVLFEDATVAHLASALRQTGETGRHTPLVPIQTKGSRPPFFCVHAAGGGAVCYTELARTLGPEQPFYGLQALDFDGGPEPSIEGIAARYTEALFDVQPSGPFYLGGWSLGGYVAFEMARQLHRAGHEVALLALLDTSARSDVEELPEDDARMLLNIVRDIAPYHEQELLPGPEVLDGLGGEEQLHLVLDALKAADLVPPEVDAGQIRRYLRNYRARLRALRSYVPQNYPGRVTLIRAAGSNGGAPASAAEDGGGDLSLGWEALAGGGVEVFFVPGEHGGMIYPPSVESLAERLRECIGDAGAKGPGSRPPDPAGSSQAAGGGSKMREMPCGQTGCGLNAAKQTT